MSANKDARRASKSDHEIEVEVDRLERCATACGVLVVIGVIGEYVPRVMEFEACGTLWTMLAFRELFGGILIAVGVAGEVLFSKMASLRQVQLSIRKDHKVAELDVVAKQADLARAKIERRLQSRELTDEELEALKETVNQFAGQAFWIITRTSDHDDEYSEQNIFSNQLSSCLTAAGWQSRLYEGAHKHRAAMRVLKTGIFITSGSGEVANSAARLLGETLESFSLGYVAYGFSSDDIGADSILIEVGLK